MAVYTISEGITKALPFLVFPIVAYYLTRSEFGIVSNYSTLIQILSPLILFSTNSYFATEYYKSTPKERSKIIANSLLLNLVIAFFLILTILAINNSIDKLIGLPLIYLIFAVCSSLISPITDFFVVKLRLEEKAKKFTYYNIIVSLFSALTTIIVLVILKWGLFGRILSLFFVSILSGVIAFYFLKKDLVFKFDLKLLKSLFVFGLPLIPHNLSFWLKSGFEKLFISYSSGLENNGLYSFASTLNSVFTIFAAAFFSAFTPYVYQQLSKINEDNLYQIKSSLVKKSYFFLFGFFLVLVFGYFVSYSIVSLFLKEKFYASLEFLPYLMMSNFFMTCYSIFAVYLFYTKTTKFIGIITITVSFFQVILCVYLVNICGAKGAAISSIIGSFLTFISVAYFSYTKYKMPWIRSIQK